MAAFKKTVFWSVYVSIALVGILTLACLVVITIAPTFFPEINISGFVDYINVFATILSFLSVGLGAYSIYQANVGSKQTNEILRAMNELKNEQERTKEVVQGIVTKIDIVLQKDDSQWKTDRDVT